METTRARSLHLSPKTVREVFQPARLEIYESLQVHGPSSIADLARRLGRPADALYYHVRKLLSVGVIEERPQEAGSGSGRPGKVYAATSEGLDAQLDNASKRSQEAWSDGARAVLRVVQRDVDRAVAAPGTCTDGKRRDLALRRIKVRLNAAQLAEVNARLEELSELLYGYSNNTRGELLALTFALTPLEEPRR